MGFPTQNLIGYYSDIVLTMDSEMSYAEKFDYWSSNYDTSPEIDALQNSHSFSGERVLEIGCGIDRLVPHIAPHTEKYVATDVNERLIRYCREQIDVDGVSFSVVDGNPSTLSG